jgi:carbonic anhydrase
MRPGKRFGLSAIEKNEIWRGWTCMDTRLSIRTLGLKTGAAHVIRNAGGIVPENTLRSLVVSHYLLGTEEIMVINHTDCGLMHTSEQDLRGRIQNRTG